MYTVNIIFKQNHIERIGLGQKTPVVNILGWRGIFGCSSLSPTQANGIMQGGFHGFKYLIAIDHVPLWWSCDQVAYASTPASAICFISMGTCPKACAPSNSTRVSAHRACWYWTYWTTSMAIFLWNFMNIPSSFSRGLGILMNLEHSNYASTRKHCQRR